MGLLAVDVTTHGVVMSADSQPVEILNGENRVLPTTGRQTRSPIVMRTGGGFTGLVGFAGTEEIEGIETAEWLRRFSDERATDDVDAFCHALAERLTEVWRRDGLRSVLEILVTGEVGGDLQFWFVRNSQGLRDTDWKHNAPVETFITKNDLDDPTEGHIKRDRRDGETKDDVLGRLTYSFRQGVLVPGARVFNGFGDLLGAMYAEKVEGFAPVDSLDDLGQFARVRMEFLKRLCTAKYGIYDENTPPPVGGKVHVLGVGRDGRICDYHKGRDQVETLRPARTTAAKT
jgi:hypothetical protein